MKEVMLPETAQEEFSAALDEAVAEVLRDAGVLHPPVDALALAQGLGVVIAMDESQTVRARVVRLGPRRGGATRPTIFLRDEPRPERQQWAVAHELGELLAHRVFSQLQVDPLDAQPGERETVANAMAGRLLLPQAWFHEAARRVDWDLLALKQVFATASHELIARRMLDFPPSVVVTVFDHGRVSFRRGNLPGRVPALFEEERRCRDEVNRTGRPFRAKGVHAVQGWPVHEPSWRREILRTEINEDVLAEAGCSI